MTPVALGELEMALRGTSTATPPAAVETNVIWACLCPDLPVSLPDVALSSQDHLQEHQLVGVEQ